MKTKTSTHKIKSIDPALTELIKLLAKAAVEDYLVDLEQVQEGNMEDGIHKN